MQELIYLNDDIDAVIERVLNDKELVGCGLTKDKVLVTLESFLGDEIACSVFYKKYALKNKEGIITELTLNESKDRWARAIVAGEVFEQKKDFDYFRELYDYMLPAGRQMYALGNDSVPKATYTNCYVIGLEDDSIEGIYETAKNMAKTYSYGGGVGVCLGKLRPKGAKVSNSAKFSTGAVSFMELYSNTTGVIGQCIAKGEKVLTDRGLVSIEDVIPNKDSAWTKEGFVKVIDKFNNGVKEIYQTTDRYGFKIKTSKDHIFVTEVDGKLIEKKLCDFSVGEDILLISGTESKRDNYLIPFPSSSFDIKHSKFDYINDINYLPTKAFNKIRNYNENEYRLHAPLIKTQVKKIEYVGMEETFDLELEKEHLFYCQGYLVHNSARRGALMVSIPVDHPDIEDFVEIKHNNTDKVKHANISVKITDDFMNAVVEDKDFELTFTTKHEEIKKTIRAKDLWDKIISSAHNSAEPGVLFWTHAQDMSPSDTYDELKIHTTNPCLTGDTLVCVSDERESVRFDELAKTGKDVRVFCVDGEENIVERVMRNPRKTGVREVYKVFLNNGFFFKATNNHKFLDDSGNFKEINEFKIGDGLKCFVNKDKSSCKIIKKEYCGIEEVFNGTVDEFHNYLITHEKHQSFQIVSKNCGEQFLEGGANLSGNCNLASIMLNQFVEGPFTEKASFNFDKFKDIVSRGVRHLDNIIEINDGRHALEGQNKAAKLGRRLGLGFTGLADTFVALGYAYDSEEALEFTEKLMKIKMETEYNASIYLAAERGAFPLYDPDKHFERGFCKNLPEDIKERAKKFGLRNVALSTIAPSGSISIMAQCSSGIEPIFALKYQRFTMLGGNERKEFTIYHQALSKYFSITDQNDIPDYWKVAHQIDYNYRIKLQGVLQKYIDASISSTINLPSDVSVETVGQIYIDAWREGLKGITVYREGSREGILITDEFVKQAGVPDMDSVTYRVTAEGGDKFYVIVSYRNKNIKEPYQIFVLNYKQGDQDSFVKIGNSLMKMLRSKGIEEERITKYSNRSKNSLEKLTRFLSLSMKTGNVVEAVEILNEHAFVGTLALKFYEILSKSVEAKKGLCKNLDCKSSNVRMEEGCMHCLDCGWSGCN